jgi:hypothetical protein
LAPAKLYISDVVVHKYVCIQDIASPSPGVEEYQLKSFREGRRDEKGNEKKRKYVKGKERKGKIRGKFKLEGWVIFKKGEKKKMS